IVRSARKFGSIEGGGKTLLLAIIAGALPKAGTPDAGRTVTALQLTVRVLPDDVVNEQVLGDDDIAFEAKHLGDVRDAPRAVAQARCLDDDVDGRDDHLADGARGQREAAHGYHRFEAAQRLARRIRVQRS